MRFQFAAGASAIVLCAAITSASGSAPGQDGARGAVPTFTKDIAPIFYKNCTGCHRPGEIAPMSLLTYDKRAAVREGDPQQGRRRHHASVACRQGPRQVRQRARPERPGEGRHPALGEQRRAPGRSEGPASGAEVRRRAGRSASRTRSSRCRSDYKVPADGFVEYEYFEIPTNFTEDKWVQSVEVRPGARDVVHHVIVSHAARPSRKRGRPASGSRRAWTSPADRRARPRPSEPHAAKDRASSRGRSASARSSAGSRPARARSAFDPGTAVLIRAGSTIVLQMHYTPNGKETTDSDEDRLHLREAVRPSARCGSGR